MKISFDLDDTLIPAQKDDFLTEKKTAFQKLLGIESLRMGTRALITDLRNAGHQVGVYTTSYRSLMKIRTQFWSYGISLDFIINEEQNRNRQLELGISSSKYPPAFDIDLHIDDSKGVEMEGAKHKFDVVVVGPELDWDHEIRENVLRVACIQEVKNMDFRDGE